MIKKGRTRCLYLSRPRLAFVSYRSLFSVHCCSLSRIDATLVHSNWINFESSDKSDKWRGRGHGHRIQNEKRIKRGKFGRNVREFLRDWKWRRTPRRDANHKRNKSSLESRLKVRTVVCEATKHEQTSRTYNERKRRWDSAHIVSLAHLRQRVRETRFLCFFFSSRASIFLSPGLSHFFFSTFAPASLFPFFPSFFLFFLPYSCFISLFCFVCDRIRRLSFPFFFIFRFVRRQVFVCVCVCVCACVRACVRACGSPRASACFTKKGARREARGEKLPLSFLLK